MNIINIFTGNKKLLALLSVIFLGGGFIADFITTLFWWSKIQPWYGYNKGKSRMLEYSSLSCWVISLIGLLAMTTFIVIHLFIKTLSEKISEGKYGFMQVIVIGCLSIGSIIPALIASSLGLRNDKTRKWDPNKKEYVMKSCKCYKIFLFEGNDEWWDTLKEKNLEDKYWKWTDTVFDKAVHTYYEYEDIVHTYSNYLCANVGAPTLIFAIFQIIGIILFIIALNATNKNENNENSENENDEK